MTLLPLKMSHYSKQTLVDKLEKLTMQTDSIQVTSLWLMFHRTHARESVETWARFMDKTSKKLAFLYLCNDLLQNSRKKGPEYTDEFKRVLPGVFRLLGATAGKDKPKVNRILQVWKERNVYQSEYIHQLQKQLENGTAVASPTSSSTPSIPSPVHPLEENTSAIPADILPIIKELENLKQLGPEKLALTTKMNGIRSNLYHLDVHELQGDQLAKVKTEIEQAQDRLQKFSHVIQAELDSRKKILDFINALHSQQTANIQTLELISKVLFYNLGRQEADS